MAVSTKKKTKVDAVKTKKPRRSRHGILHYKVDKSCGKKKDDPTVYHLQRLVPAAKPNSGSVRVNVCGVCLNDDPEDRWCCMACLVSAHHACMTFGNYPQLNEFEPVGVCRTCLTPI